MVKTDFILFQRCAKSFWMHRLFEFLETQI